MSAGGIERRIFVVGAPRSGTTLVQSLLAAHDRATSFTESHFFTRRFHALPSIANAVLLHDPMPRFRSFLDENEAGELRGGMERRLRGVARPRWMLPFRTAAVAGAFLEALDELALARGRSIWIEKTPRHLRFVPFLERISTAPTRFVHVVRSGDDVVSSLHRASRKWERPYSLETCVRRWNRDVAFSLSRAASRADVFVLYEQLTSAPEETLERLFSSLGLDWQPEILDRYAQESARLTTSEESWKSAAQGAIRPSRASLENLTEEQRERVRRGLREELYSQVERLLGAPETERGRARDMLAD